MNSYFDLRNVAPSDYADYTLSAWLRRELPGVDSNPRILDFGCGFGQLMRALKSLGYPRVEGADVEPAAIDHCRNNGMTAHDLGKEAGFYDANRGQFDFIVTQHVLEHIPKAHVIEVVSNLKTLLSPTGRLVVAVPNAQAFTGAYWAYEDFTHQTLFTSGSIYYVLKAAGFDGIQFLDVDCSAGMSLLKGAVRRMLWRLYGAYYGFMCKVMASPTHEPSPNIFSYEIKVVAK